MVQGDGDGSGWDYAAYDFRFGICCGKRRYGFAALSLYQKGKGFSYFNGRSV